MKNKMTFECMSCYRTINTRIEEIEEDGGFVCKKNGELVPSTRVIVKYYDCPYCQTKLKYVEPEFFKEFIAANRRFKFFQEKLAYKNSLTKLFDLWGDLDLIHLFIGEEEFIVEKRSLGEYINEKECYVQCRTDDREKLRVTTNDWKQIKN
jgi:hypothetical protein